MIERSGEARCDSCGRRVRHGEKLVVREYMLVTSIRAEVECEDCAAPQVKVAARGEAER